MKTRTYLYLFENTAKEMGLISFNKGKDAEIPMAMAIGSSQRAKHVNEVQV